MKVVPDKLRERWSSDEIRVLVLGSLGIQIALIFLAPFRKRSTKSYLTLTLWILYLTADYVATLALGNVLSKQTDTVNNPTNSTLSAGSGSSGVKQTDQSTGSGSSGAIPGELTALWAPFLLLHLGGPDTITSYSIEDNELWWRHLLGLVVQVFTAAFAFLQSPPNPGLWIPTILVFIPGLIKFIERTLALRSGSKDKLKDKIISELGPQYKTEVKFILDEIDISKDESQLIKEGYEWFNIFKRLLVDVTFPSDLLMKSQDRFADIKQKEALKMVAVELSFLYDILHTKAVHVHCFSGRMLRCCSLASIIGGLIIFHHLALHDHQKKEKKYDPVDITITYILFGAGLGLEVIAIMLLMFSDWTVVSLKNSGHGGFFARGITAMIKGTLSFTQKITQKITKRKGTLRADKPRWSHTIGQHNLVGLCLRDRNMFAWIMKKLKIKKKWDNMRETKSVPVPDCLEGIMFTEAKRRAQNVHIYNVLVEARTYRGSKALDRHGLKDLGWSMRREFDECIILWHVATDICYYKDSNYNEPERDASLEVSNYMVYLLTQQSSMLQLGYGKTRFEATCDVVKKMFKDQKNLDNKAARELLEHETNNNSNGQSGQTTEPDETEQEKQGKLVLADGRRLAKDLQEEKIGQKLRWQLISETWMEMLGYAAIHCDSYQHAKALSRGGELLTHFWLLMAQMGVVEEHKMQQFQSGSV